MKKLLSLILIIPKSAKIKSLCFAFFRGRVKKPTLPRKLKRRLFFGFKKNVFRPDERRAVKAVFSYEVFELSVNFFIFLELLVLGLAIKNIFD